VRGKLQTTSSKIQRRSKLQIPTPINREWIASKKNPKAPNLTGDKLPTSKAFASRRNLKHEADVGGQAWGCAERPWRKETA